MEKTELIISYFTQFFFPYLRSLNRHKYKDEKTIFRFQTKVIAELLNVYRSAFQTSQNSFEFQITLKIKYSHLRSQSSLHVERAYKTTGNFRVFFSNSGDQETRIFNPGINYIKYRLLVKAKVSLCLWFLQLDVWPEWFKFRGLMYAPIFHVFSR